MVKKSKIQIVFLAVVFISVIFNIAMSLPGITNTVSWIFGWICKPLLIILLLISIITVITAIIHCFVKKKSTLIITALIFACMTIYASFVYSSFSPIREQSKSTKVFSELTDINNINILNVSDMNKSISENTIFISIFGKNALEAEYYTPSGRQNDSEDYDFSQEIFVYENMFFVNRKKLSEDVKFYYTEKDIWGFNITDEDIHSFTKGNAVCTYTYKSETNSYSPDYELAYYSFVIYTNERVYVSSYDLMCTNSFVFDAEKTTEKIVDELISKGCL